MKRQNIAVFVLVILGILVLALLLRHFQAPRDCITNPQNPACQNQLIALGLWSVNFRTIRLGSRPWYLLVCIKRAANFQAAHNRRLLIEENGVKPARAMRSERKNGE